MPEVDELFQSAVQIKTFIGKTVQIEAAENTSYTGKVYVIDPIYKTIVLHCINEANNKVRTVFVFGHAIKSLKILSDTGDTEDQMDESHLTEDRTLTSSGLAEKNRLKKWLKQRLINVQESGDNLKIDNHLVILPPYTMKSCICRNAIVLERIWGIISEMPKDFQ